MEIKKGTKKINSGKKTAIIEFVFTDYVIFVFQGDLSQFDILIKYKKDRVRIRTPKHVHWVVDVLMKMQGSKKLTKQFLKSIQKCWNECIPLPNNDFNTLKTLIENEESKVSLEKYSALNKYGEYNIEFLYVLMELLAIQEKTNRPDAYMFGNIIQELLETDQDIFKIISTAGFRGRRS